MMRISRTELVFNDKILEKNENTYEMIVEIPMGTGFGNRAWQI